MEHLEEAFQFLAVPAHIPISIFQMDGITPHLKISEY
jgi:hypothetical protein